MVRPSLPGVWYLAASWVDVSWGAAVLFHLFREMLTKVRLPVVLRVGSRNPGFLNLSRGPQSQGYFYGVTKTKRGTLGENSHRGRYENSDVSISSDTGDYKS